MQRALQALPGVTQVVINALNHRVRVDYDCARINLDLLLAAVREAGFVAQAV